MYLTFKVHIISIETQYACTVQLQNVLLHKQQCDLASYDKRSFTQLEYTLMETYFVKTGNCAPITLILAIRRNRVLPTNTADLMMDPTSQCGIAGLPFNIVINIPHS